MLSERPCGTCGTKRFVRTERILQGDKVFTLHYCGRCDRTWRLSTLVDGANRRVVKDAANWQHDALARMRTD